MVQLLQKRSSARGAYATAANEYDALVAYSDLHAPVARLAALTPKGDLEGAVDAAKALRAHLAESGRVVPRWIARTATWTTLTDWARAEDSRLDAALTDLLDRFVVIEDAGEGLAVSLVLRQELSHDGSRQATPPPPMYTLPRVIELFATLSTAHGDSSAVSRRMDDFVARLAARLLARLIEPFLERAGHHVAVETEPISERDVRVTMREGTGGDFNAVTYVEELLRALAEHSSLLGRTPLAPVFTRHFVPPLQDCLVRDVLERSRPPRPDGLEAYVELAHRVEALERDTMPSLGCFAFDDRLDGSARSVCQAWVANLAQHWARSRGDAALEQVRELVARNTWDSETVDVEIPLPETPKVEAPAPVADLAPAPEAVEAVSQEEYRAQEGYRAPSPEAAAPARRGGKIGARKISTSAAFLPPVSPELARGGAADPWGLDADESAEDESEPANTTANRLAASTSSILSAELAPPSPDAGEGPGEDDGWGFGLDEQEPTSPPQQDETPGDDGWGLEGDVLESPPPDSKADPVESAEDDEATEGWGVDVDPQGAAQTPKVDEDAGWGFDGDEAEAPDVDAASSDKVPSEAGEKTENGVAAPTKELPQPEVAGKADTGDGWGLDENADDGDEWQQAGDDWAFDDNPAKVARRRSSSSKEWALNGKERPRTRLETMAISKNCRQLCRVIDELLQDAAELLSQRCAH